MGSVHRVAPNTVHNEFVKGVVTYSRTGERPHDHFFNRLNKLVEKNPTKFSQNFPKWIGFFHDANNIGDLPRGHYWDMLRCRYESNPHRFSLNHCEYIVDAVKRAECVVASPCQPRPIVTPEPSSVAALTIGLLLMCLFRKKIGVTPYCP